MARYKSEDDRVQSCEGKASFNCYSTASTAAKRRKARKAYRCKYCGKYHVGTQRHEVTVRKKRHSQKRRNML